MPFKFLERHSSRSLANLVTRGDGMTAPPTAQDPPAQPPPRDEVFQVEEHGIDPIPESERHGGARDLFWLWFGSNLTFTYVINGALAVSFGLSFWQAVLAV